MLARLDRPIGQRPDSSRESPAGPRTPNKRQFTARVLVLILDRECSSGDRAGWVQKPKAKGLPSRNTPTPFLSISPFTMITPYCVAAVFCCCIGASVVIITATCYPRYSVGSEMAAFVSYVGSGAAAFPVRVIKGTQVNHDQPRMR